MRNEEDVSPAGAAGDDVNLGERFTDDERAANLEGAGVGDDLGTDFRADAGGITHRQAEDRQFAAHAASVLSRSGGSIVRPHMPWQFRTSIRTNA